MAFYYTYPLQGVSQDASGNSTIAGTMTAANFSVSPNTGFVGWASLTRLKTATDGVLRIAKNADGNPTTLVSGIIVGPADANGRALVFDSSYGFRSMTGNMGANSGFAGAAFNATGTANVTHGVNIGAGSQCGMGFPTLTSVGFYINNAQYGLLDASGQWSNMRVLTAAKTTNYTVLDADSGTHFTNNGAAGAVQFTLPTAVQGLIYRFSCTAAQVLTVTTGAGSILGPGSLTGATRTITGTTAANRYSSFEVVCFDGTNWVMRAGVGTIT